MYAGIDNLCVYILVCDSVCVCVYVAYDCVQA